MQNPEALSAVARQLKLEAQSHETAKATLASRTRKAEDRAYGSATIYGKKALDAALPVVSEYMAKRYGEITSGRSGQAGRDYAGAVKVIQTLGSEVTALITLKSILDELSQTKFDKDTFRYIRVCSRIGANLQTEARLKFYQESNPELYGRTEHFFHKGSGTRQKATVLTRRFNKEGYEWQRWPQDLMVSIGAWCLRMVAEPTGWVTTEKVPYKGKKEHHVVRLTNEFLGLRDSILERAMELAYNPWPMVCQPVPWTTDPDHKGGYLTADARQQDLVRRGGKVQQGHLPVEAINRLQNVPYRINSKILEVAKELAACRMSIGDFHQDEAKVVHNYLTEDSSEEEIKQYKWARRAAEDWNSRLFQRNWRTSEALKVAEIFKEETFWVPFNFDYRGRMYPLTITITPQGTDFDKALLYFAEEGPVNEWWLAFHLATTYGMDKAESEARVAWVRDNTDTIAMIASDPAGSTHLWEDASEPWSFLAACIEYNACVLEASKATSGLPCGIDATCSGMQHLSALTGDSSTAREVNVIPTPKPSDAYRTVAEAALRDIPSKWHEHMDRKITKRTVMTLPYGVSWGSARDYIRDAFNDKGIDLGPDLKVITKAVYDMAVPEVFPGPIRVMEWLKKAASKILETREVIEWITPSGFHVYQDQRKPNWKIVNTKLLGVGRLQNSCWMGPGEVDKRGHIKSLPPNFIHSLDASLMHFTASDWDRPISMIHDCVLGRSCDMDDLGATVRTHFVEMYKGLPLHDFAAQIGVEIPDGIYLGDLDLDDVLKSEYFFC